MNKDTLIELLIPHKENLTTVGNWDEYASKHNLPSYYSLRKVFGGWNEIRNAVGVKIKKKYDIDSLIEIGKKHREHAKTIRLWNKFASNENGIPSPGQILTVFKDWSSFKKAINVESVRATKYTKIDIKKMLEEHKEFFISRSQWDTYAKENKLPTYKTIRNYYSYEEILNIVEKKKTFNLSKDELIELTLRKEYFYKFLNSSKTKWDEFARANNLPSSYKYIQTFDTWLKAKEEIDNAYLINSRGTDE
ncbi:hypothetical protein [Niallia sp. MER TA 168]|uniref:hypothetical protein n=1 Tax=Niallia sp. MER TA 168 TaxID=2939568 RepID=UPI00203AC6B3|nr:hypothetical protein [Niallia sp. MER TA 168]MCM3362551.1 hypothetical protein [Niallia sp. MER TA 168]